MSVIPLASHAGFHARPVPPSTDRAAMPRAGYLPALTRPGAATPLTYTIFDLQRRLGQYDRSITWTCRYLTALQVDRGFPAPFPVMRGERLIDEPTGGSRWPIEPVDRWFLDCMPSDIALSIDLATLADQADSLDANAMDLRL